MKVSLFATCLIDMFQSQVGKDAVEVLESLGCEVDFPESQVCCGQPAYNSGYVNDSKEAMKRMMTAFEDSQYVVGLSGSCTYMFHEYPAIFKGDPVWEEKAKALAEKTFEFTQFIVDVLQVKHVGAKLNGKATYHTSCHMTRLLGVTEAPLTLLNHVEGLEFVELPGKQNCCGFGGTFSVKMSPISEQMVDEKVRHITNTEADYVIGADCGCLLNIGGRMERQQHSAKVLHIAEVLNKR
ncbi:L-lactate dehydrogenase complex protein LldE [Sporosarcina luteola]|nr:L-lactate dehydrogenase complex protein LldE [Sporosarcina luteola]